MVKIIYKILKFLFTLSIFSALIYFFRADLSNFKNRFTQQYFPCQKPITYQIDKFDQHFGISQKVFLTSVAEAEKIWEKASGLNLFEYTPSGTLKINLIYDNRQDATIKLRQLGMVVKDDKATYDKLNINFRTLEKSYQIDKINLDNQVVELDRRFDAYNKEVKNLNSRGGYTPAEIEYLKTFKAELDQMVAKLDSQQNIFNNKIDELNALAETLNRLAKTLNLSVDRYNTVSASRGSEFEEGTYISSANGQQIDIYQFDNTIKLVRVLAHELGHALGLDHVSSTVAMMYYLNNGITDKLAPADLQALKQHCAILP